MVIHKLEAIFGIEALEPSIAMKVMAYSVEHSGQVHHINLAFVKSLCGLPNTQKSDVSVLKTLQVLAGDAIGFLRVGFEYVDDNECIHKISHIEFVDAIKHGIDPLTGEKSENDLAERVLIYYFPDTTFPERLIKT